MFNSPVLISQKDFVKFASPFLTKIPVHIVIAGKGISSLGF
jgi:hypothetical protein